MVKQDMLKLSEAISAVYPMFKKDRTPEQMKILMQLWFDILQDIEFEYVISAFRSYMMLGNQFPPTVSDLLNQITAETTQDEAYSSFDRIIKLIQQYGVYNYKNAYEQMNDIEKQIVTETYFMQLGLSDQKSINTMRSQYRDFYTSTGKTRIKNQKQLATNTVVNKLTDIKRLQ